MTHRHRRTLAFASALAVVACGRNDARTAAVDSSLGRDLTTAAQVSQFPPADTVTALERTAAAPAPAQASVAAAPVRRSSAPRRVHRSTSAGEVASSGTAASSGSSAAAATAPAPESHTVTVKHTKRDAAIGAAAGAIIGATTSRDKVKGGVIGGAAGAILGGVLGNNVDKKKKTVP